MFRITPLCNICRVLVALALALASGSLAKPACAAQDAVELPGAENFREVRIVGGERLVLMVEE